MACEKEGSQAGCTLDPSPAGNFLIDVAGFRANHQMNVSILFIRKAAMDAIEKDGKSGMVEYFMSRGTF